VISLRPIETMRGSASDWPSGKWRGKIRCEGRHHDGLGRRCNRRGSALQLRPPLISNVVVVTYQEPVGREIEGLFGAMAWPGCSASRRAAAASAARLPPTGPAQSSGIRAA